MPLSVADALDLFQPLPTEVVHDWLLAAEADPSDPNAWAVETAADAILAERYLERWPDRCALVTALSESAS